MVAPEGVGVRGFPLPFTALSKAVLQLPGGARGGRLQRKKRKAGGVHTPLLCPQLSGDHAPHCCHELNRVLQKYSLIPPGCCGSVG